MTKRKYSTFEIWFLASRPKTLFAAFVPVIVGASLAFAEGKLNLTASIVALLCSILFQVGANFTNDLYDFLKGADTEKRIGPIRVLNAGLVSPRQMKIVIIYNFGLAFLLGLYLVYIAGNFILIIGLLSIIASLAYTAGPYPLAYHGLGELFVFLFFGFVGTVGTFFVNTKEISTIAFIAAIPVGALITNILVVNNYRDRDQDKAAGKNTLAVTFGQSFSRYEYVILLFSSFFVPFLMYANYNFSFWIFLPYLTLPLAYKLMLSIFKQSGIQLNSALELTAKFSALFGFLLSLGCIL
ncbi:MAG: 1,4-dihydroxy-2-naphthoate polyprenyltransferase [Ignavibacteria bacterium CG22_combo_CG10-13_8_21_14_all_37_15]|nr:1,4-dihydroxy-2-naphthoate polyprenyltransferase [Ignavibacteria bacterium]OIO22407.1 MAG: 1,4-dihydroxy-2-naphthoate octaprenyltransferase [Ignavibacteria bacterium CG1_02_37_35]PIP77446.1 MAG: 1,4-dihydroxy-2-naphthoate polyprenyltransferase [Ignavibacteria bacterium CG22_combo_CG10-13_8_21_14_all_37_15]PIS45330.1 MAG: 1,4-dihydroxy-2-naphthoate polyprenyltransferase [Ignavibacteria bacterium CG08_land_8_20_14_0_20_37_9]PIX93897.1 MAG: 1,4-dihydroxy-2-naphthoate polyprenyltransferase [Igna